MELEAFKKKEFLLWFFTIEGVEYLSTPPPSFDIFLPYMHGAAMYLLPTKTFNNFEKIY